MDSAVRPLPADEEEARRRRSTDCIYFLASPLTCKKGNECEYRHSDAARMNPRDCWYWFNGNCANPKCSFRHPPLDSLLGAPATPRAAQQSAPQVSVPAQPTLGPTPASGTTKQGVPCYYFQKGMCVKGDRCAFLHVPQAAGNIILQQTSKVFAPALQPHPQPKNSWTKPHSLAQHNTPPAILDKLKVEAHIGKPAQKQNLTSRLDCLSGISQNHNNPYVLSGAAKNYQPEPSVEDDLAENGMEVGEFVRDPSAGSGVLVGVANDDAEQSFREGHNSYHRTNGEKHTGMLRQKHASYESERLLRSSAERLLSERRISERGPPPVTADNSYLQHRMLKQRRLNNPRSTELPDRHDVYPEEERRGHQRWRGEAPAIHDGLSRSRLHGRIKLPGETLLDRLGPHPEKERDRGPRARLSPPKQTDLRGMLHGRLKARSNEDISRNVKSSVAKANSGEDVGSLSFAGPKSLAELKAKKVADVLGDHGIRSGGSFAGPARMTSEIVAIRESSNPVPFDGPKPLSVILKRKREAASENATNSGSIQEVHTVGEKEEPQDKLRKLENEKVGTSTEGNWEEAFHPEDDMAFDDNLSPPDDNAAEATGDAGKELEEQQELEVAEEYDYDEAADVDAEEDNDDYQEYEDDGLDDDDDFARKMGVMI